MLTSVAKVESRRKSLLNKLDKVAYRKCAEGLQRKMFHIESRECVEAVVIFVRHVKCDISIQVAVSGEIDSENVVDVELSSCVSVLCNPLKKEKSLLLSFL